MVLNTLPSHKITSDSLLSGNSGLMVIISSPSGVGKTTISNKLLKIEKNITKSISVTTRAPRNGEVSGVDYYFVTEDKFTEMRRNNKMIEHARVFGFGYGIPRERTEQLLYKGFDVVFNIDWQGAFKLMEEKKDNLVSIFLLPPSIKELERRIRKRGTNSESDIAKRLSLANFEMEKCTHYDYVIINDDSDKTTLLISKIMHSEKSKTHRHKNLPLFLSSMRNESND